MPRRDRHRDTRRHQHAPTTGRHDRGLPGNQVEAGVAFVGVRRQSQLGVEANAVESQAATDYPSNLTNLVNQG